MAGEAPIILFLLISGLWIVSAGDFGDKYTDLTHGALFYTCVYFKHLGYDGVETQKNLCEIVNEIKLNTSSIQTEEPESFDGSDLVDTFNSDKLMDWCFFNRPDDEVGQQTQSDACQKLIEIVKPYANEDEIHGQEIQEYYIHGQKFKHVILKPLEVDAAEYYIPGEKFNIILEEEEIEEDDIDRDVYKDITDVESLVEKMFIEENDFGYTNQHFVSSVKEKEKEILAGIKIDPFSFLRKDKEVFPSNSKIIELQESKANLATKMRGLNQDLQKSGLELAHQVKTYLTDLALLKKSLTAEMEQLKTDYQNLITTLQQQEENFYASLRYLGLGHVSRDLNETKMSAD